LLPLEKAILFFSGKIVSRFFPKPSGKNFGKKKKV